MNGQNVLNSLQIRNDSLKSKLFHEQLKSDNFSFKYHNKYINLILNEYKKNKSLVKSAQTIGIDYEIVFKWYVQGQRGNLNYRGFYLAIRDMNDSIEDAIEEIETPQVEQIDNGFDDGEYLISQYGDGWSYKTYIDGEKIFIISNELETLKKKVKDKRLPID